jgi:nicotinamidase-related amidase
MRTAVLILDMISEFDFPNGGKLVRPALRAARHIRDLRRRATRARWPIIYVNDAPQIWESNPSEFVGRCARPGAPGRQIAEMLAPETRDYFLFKPRHSAFFDTSLDSLLARLRVQRVILTGITAHQCVLFTAMDAHVRDYDIRIVRNCVAAFNAAQKQRALWLASESLEADVV